MAIPTSTRENGDVFLGTGNIADQIPGNGGQLEFRWVSARAAQDSLNFNDVQMGVRIWYGIPPDALRETEVSGYVVG